MNPRLKKIGRNILFLLAIPAIIGAFVFANSNKQDEILQGIHVDIENTELSFVTKEDVFEMIASNDVEVHQSVLNSIQIDAVENTIKQNPWVKNAEIYITANHTINVKVTQKEPIVRINQLDSIDYAYYLDEHANPIALSSQYIAKVPVVTSASLGYTIKDLQFKHDLVQLANYIKNDTFWNAMITQINVASNHQIELIPALGNHLILLGAINDLDSKMKRLLALYQNGLTTIDWNRYNEIDLRYAHQVVARNTNITELVDETLMKAKQEEKSKAIKSKSQVDRPNTNIKKSSLKKSKNNLNK